MTEDGRRKMSKEIKIDLEYEVECIKKRLSNGAIEFDRGDIENLLSSLEKEEQAHTMSVYDLNMKIAELGIALEKEKERAESIQEHANDFKGDINFHKVLEEVK